MANKFDWWSRSKYQDCQKFKNDIKARFNEVRWAYNAMIDHSNRFNKDDFVYYTKMLFENGNVYISEEALKLIKNSGTDLFKDEEIEKLKRGDEQEDYLQPKTHAFKSYAGAQTSLIWEHVVPTHLLIEEFFKSNDPSLEEYTKLLNYGMVCIVTKEEDNKLTSNGYRSKMPNNICLKNNPWARYQECGINVVNL